MKRRFVRDRGRGQALVEFALIIPIFLLVVLGLFDLGRAVLYHSTLSNASREAVRLAIVDQNPAAIRTRAVDGAAALMHVDPADVVITHLDPALGTTAPCSVAPFEVGCVVKVEVSYDFFPATPFVGQMTLRAETHQPIERRYASP